MSDGKGKSVSLEVDVKVGKVVLLGVMVDVRIRFVLGANGVS